jgi:peroxiredoxin
MVKKLLLLFVFTTVHYCVFATIISGVDTNYANTEIVLLKSADPFSGAEMELARTVVDTAGRFSINLDLYETTYVYAYLGTNKVYLYAEPSKAYKIVLPLYTEKNKADELNPFFKFGEVHLGIKNILQDDLNLQIKMFMDSFNPFYKKHAQLIFSDKINFEQLDSDIKQLDKPFSKSANTYFNDFRKYKFGLLRFVAYQRKSRSISDSYFKGQPFLGNNPAYVELFNMVYLDYFTHFARSEQGKQLVSALSSNSYREVKSALAQDKVLQPDKVLNMVMLKCLQDEFYDDNYSRNALLAVLDSFLLSSTDDLEILTAQNIRNKVTKLLVGFEPPAFELYDTDSNLVSLESLRGKFIYLNFCSCFSYTCLNEFAMLQNIYNKHNKYLEIVSIVIDEDVQVVKDFVERSGYSWTFLHFDNNPHILQDYDIRTFPTYYLIDDEGKLSMSPAASPNEEFEGRLFKVLRAKGIL